MAFGDRRDGKLLKNLDGMHYFVPMLYPNRCDNEAFISEIIDLSNIDKYLKKKNKNNPEYKYNLFQVIVTACLKMLYLRPKMNYFIANKNMYERTEKTCSFVVKKKFVDDGQEGLAIIKSKPEYTIDDIHKNMESIIYSQKNTNNNKKEDSSTYFMNLFSKVLPRFISKIIAFITRILDKYGLVPKAFIASDPYYTSIVLSNLGSIKLHSGYHHLTNWGTNSIFVTIGEIKKRPFTNESGQTKMKNSIDLGFTIDERIADGYYYSRTIALVKKLLENPELLDEPLDKEVDY